MAPPAVVFDGWTPKASFDAPAGVMLNPLLVTEVRPLLVAWRV